MYPRCPPWFLTKKQKIPRLISQTEDLKFNLGNDLLSHNLNTAVSSAMEGLTAGFGMGPGVPPPLWLPRNLLGAVARADVHAHAKHPMRP